MSRLIFLFVIVAAIYWLLKSYLKQPMKPSEPKSSEDMVRCAQCGVHLPKSESILVGGEYFCSAAHRRDHPDHSN